MEHSKEYMKFMEQAPQIKASGLDGDYRALVEFNNVVLAGHQTRFGMEFVTWEWVQNHTSLWQGHYYGDDYDAAKQDFTIRSGLLPSEQLFSDEQLTEIYRSIHETLESEYPLIAVSLSPASQRTVSLGVTFWSVEKSCSRPPNGCAAIFEASYRPLPNFTEMPLPSLRRRWSSTRQSYSATLPEL